MNSFRGTHLLLVCTIVLLVQPSMALAQLTPTYVFTGNAGSQFGLCVASAGDVNNDGHDDIIVGAPCLGSPTDSGKVMVYSGASGILLYTLVGPPKWGFGRAVAGAGDVNNDNFDDIVVGAPFADTSGSQRGVAFVYDGPTGSLLRVFLGANAGDNFGFAVDGAGDINNDGFDDVIIGSPASDSFGVDAGLVAVYSGQTGARLRLHGGGTGDELGWAVHGAGHVNGDPQADYAASAPFDGTVGDTAGMVVVFSGATGAHIYNILGSAALEECGYAFDAGGNFGNLGFGGDDLLIGAPNSNYAWPTGGKVTVYYGETGGPDGASGRSGESNLYYGGAVAWGSDVNADSLDDQFIGAPLSDVFGVDAGFVAGATSVGGSYFFQGGEHPGDNYGWSIAAADVSGDQIKDLIVGAPFFPTASLDSGRVYVYVFNDDDSDGVVSTTDNCPSIYNPTQADADLDGIGDACEITDTLTFTLLSPVDMVVTDPLGDSIGIGFNTIANGSTYDTLTDTNGDLELDDRVTIPNPLAGDYRVRIIPESGAAGSDKFTLTIRIDGNQQLIPDDYHNQTISALGNTVPDTYVWTAATTLPGDANADGKTTAADIIYLVNYVFKSGPDAVVPGHGDINCSGAVTSADIIALVNFVFKSGAPPCSADAG